MAGCSMNTDLKNRAMYTLRSLQIIVIHACGKLAHKTENALLTGERPVLLPVQGDQNRVIGVCDRKIFLQD